MTLRLSIAKLLVSLIVFYMSTIAHADHYKLPVKSYLVDSGIFGCRNVFSDNLRKRIVHKIPGLFPDGVPVQQFPNGWNIVDSNPSFYEFIDDYSQGFKDNLVQQTVTYFDAQGRKSVGSVTLSFDDGVLLIDSAFLNIKSKENGTMLPSWIKSPQIQPLVEDKGQPLFAYLVWRYLKKKNITAADIKGVLVKGIINIETVLEYAVNAKEWQASHPDKFLNSFQKGQFVKNTPFVNLTQTVLAQLGMRIDTIEVSGGDMRSLKELHLEHEMNDSSPIKKSHFESAGLEDHTKIYRGFDIFMIVHSD